MSLPGLIRQVLHSPARSQAHPAAAPAGATLPSGAGCGVCREFCAEPLTLEQLSPGLAVLSSAFGAVRASDGICLSHQRYVTAQAVCARFRAR